MSTPLIIDRSGREDGATTLTVTGEIDMSNSELLAEALERAEGKVVLDLSAVDYLDSAGLAVLFAHAHHIELIASPLLAPVVTISGLHQLTRVRGLRPETPPSP